MRRPVPCAPRDDGVELPAAGTCFTPRELQRVAESTGVREGRGPRGAEGAKALAARLHRHFGTRAGEEIQWLRRIRPALAQELRQSAFRPEHPAEWLRRPTAWLTNLDIANAMEQYERQLGDTRHFRFVGVFPSDFQEAYGDGRRCVSPEMCELTVRGLVDEGVHQVGVVFNLDRSGMPGSHWTACFVGLDPTDGERFGAYYFDSYAKPPLPGMAAFMERMAAEARAEGLSTDEAPFPVRYNRLRKQFKNTECGIYSILFLVLGIQTPLPFDAVCREALHDDDTTNRLRYQLFRPPAASD